MELKRTKRFLEKRLFELTKLNNPINYMSGGEMTKEIEEVGYLLKHIEACESNPADSENANCAIFDVSFAYELLKQWLEYAEGKQMSAPIEDTEKWISEYES